MKKSKLSLCLASGFVAAMSLAACGNVTSKDNVIVTVKDSNGNAIDINADAVYDKSRTSSDGVSKFYNAVLEALIRYEYENPNAAIKGWTKALKSKAKIIEEAEDKVKNDKVTANENADTNGTSYEEEWEKILTSHNCLPEDDDSETGEQKLKQYYIYQLEKEDITDKFFLQQKDGLTSEWLGVNDEGHSTEKSVRAAYPYHIRHVLTSISGGATNFYDATITESEAKNLGNTMNALLDSNYSFANVATSFSGDSGSAAKGGDLGIMTTSTSFVNEFKLGLYAYDAIYNNGSDAAIESIRNGLGLNADYKYVVKDTTGKTPAETDTLPVNSVDAFSKKINGGNLQLVPYEAFTLIKEYAAYTTDNGGKAVNDGNEHYYPRNVLFNYYLNYHNPFLITDEQIDTTTGMPKAGTAQAENAKFQTVTISIDGTATQKRVLTDGEGHVIIGVRSEHGIHFMIMEHSIFQYNEGGEDSDLASLEEYYTTSLPTDSDFPKKADGTNKETYVNYITTSDASTYTSRSSDIKNSVEGFDSTYDYRLFEYITGIEDGKVTINNTSLKPIKEYISEYIARTRTNNSINSAKSLNEAWRSYAELCALQYNSRTTWDADEVTLKDNKIVRTVHPRCAVGFKAHTGAAWEKGGVCDYEK